MVTVPLLEYLRILDYYNLVFKEFRSRVSDDSAVVIKEHVVIKSNENFLLSTYR